MTVRPGFTQDVQRHLEKCTAVPRCVYPDCWNSRRTRGLCHGHYQAARDRIRRGRVTEVELIERGLLLAKGTGGSPVNGFDAFDAGSDARGEIKS